MILPLVPEVQQNEPLLRIRRSFGNHPLETDFIQGLTA
jgi:hypothetical protein